MIANGKSCGEKTSPFLVIFSDLDGTLLDPFTYSWKDAKEAIAHCKRLDIPIILVTSKTRAELELIIEDLDIQDPFITENGGGIFFPKTRFPAPPVGSESVNNFWRWSLGVPYEILKSALKEIAAETGCKIIGFSDMDPRQISSLTGLDLEQARRAAKREFDEPFIVEDMREDQETLITKAAHRKGLKVSKGGRFFHLHGNSDKGLATRRLIGWYGDMGHSIYCLGIGDSDNDIPMLEAVDQPIFVGEREKLGSLEAHLSRLMVTTQRGPKGWNEGVMKFLKTHGGIC